MLRKNRKKSRSSKKCGPSSKIRLRKHLNDDAECQNLESVYGVKNIPSDSRMREIYDEIDPKKYLAPIFKVPFRHLSGTSSVVTTWNRWFFIRGAILRSVLACIFARCSLALWALTPNVCKVIRVGTDIFTAKEDMFRVNVTMGAKSGYLTDLLIKFSKILHFHPFSMLTANR